MKKTKRVYMSILMSTLITLLPSLIFAQQNSGGPPPLKTAELQQMLAPIALYPDTLLAQVFMASTYPLEVVEADRWAKQNAALKGDKLDSALKGKDWDVSVKSLAYYPDVLAMMSDKIEWTTKLGDAFLAQQQDILAAVQDLRAKAKAAGALKTTPQQKVVVQESAIVIQPANPQVIYVPAYNPTVVYGPWPYPAYPPYPYYSPGAVVAGEMMSFGAGFMVGAAMSSWCGVGWGHGQVTVNNNNVANISKTTNVTATNVQNKKTNVANSQSQNWQHNPDHRKNVPYRNPAVSQKYGQANQAMKRSSGDFRGYSPGDRSMKGNAGTERTETRKQPTGELKQPEKGFGKSNEGRSFAEPSQDTGRGDRESAFDSRGNGASEHAASERGQYSRSSAEGMRSVSSGGYHGGGHYSGHR